MDLKTLYASLTPEQAVRFCELAGTTDGYMRANLSYRRRIPRPALLQRLVTACQAFDPTVTQEALLAWLYDTPATPTGQGGSDPAPATQQQAA